MPHGQSVWRPRRTEPDEGAAAHRQAAAIPCNDALRHPRARARHTHGARADRVEADHRPAGHLAGRGLREARVVCVPRKIETFHKSLKSGCKVEHSKLRTAECLPRLLVVFCVLSWRIFWTTMINHSAPRAPAATARSLGAGSRKTPRPKEIPSLLPHQTARLGAILPAPMILRRATSSCGAGYPASPISNWDLPWRSLWVIERLVTCLQKRWPKPAHLTLAASVDLRHKRGASLPLVGW